MAAVDIIYLLSSSSSWSSDFLFLAARMRLQADSCKRTFTTTDEWNTFYTIRLSVTKPMLVHHNLHLHEHLASAMNHGCQTQIFDRYDLRHNPSSIIIHSSGEKQLPSASVSSSSGSTLFTFLHLQKIIAVIIFCNCRHDRRRLLQQ